MLYVVIDIVQDNKKLFNSFIQNQPLREELDRYVDSQTKFTKQFADNLHTSVNNILTIYKLK